jgi:hypothetical protein
MPKLPRTGVGYQCLYEYEVTLPDVIAGLGLKPLARKAERKIRDRLGFALARWEEPYTAIQTKDVANSLRLHAKRLDEVAGLGAITRMGVARVDELASSGQVAEALTSEPTIGTVEKAHAYLSEFCERADVIASACRFAAQRLAALKGKSGRSQYHWYDEFTAVLVEVCKLNKIEPTAGLDRTSGEPIGTLPRIAREFERLLLPRMRSRTPASMVKRLQRGLARTQKQQS